MAVGKKSYKVIIVGGSVAGLSLANMLERVGIDFVILEAYKEIAPQVGASIAIYPQFARILDQIGCWSTDGDLRDVLRDLLDDTVNHGFYRDRRGDTIFDFRGLADGLEKRHGYPVIFIERQMLLKALYENLQHKDKVLVQKRFVQIEQMKDGVRAIMQDGCSYEGDIIIGADGMHSSVRKKMHCLGNFLSPGYFDRDEYSKVSCTYKCIFGMSQPTKGIERGTNHIIMGKGYSYLILTGPGKVYWFLNVKNSQATYGKGVPQYSVEDEQRLAEQHFGDRLNEYDSFGDLYKKKIISRLTPLHEYQWKRWHFGRIMTIGDASHKLHPISGNGGAAAIEDAAALVNALQRKLDQSHQHLSTRDFQEVFAETQRVQENRTKHLLDHATKMQSFDAMESVFAPLVVRFVIPNLTDDAALAIVGENTVQGQRIQSLPVPQRDRYVPYNDELPAKPLENMPIGKACSILLYSLLFYLACLISSTSGSFTNPMGIALPGQYLDAIVDYYAPTGRRSRDGQLHSPASVISLIPIILIWNLEGHRRGNIGSLGSWPVTLLFVAALSVAGPAKILPLYFLLAVCNSCRAAYASVAGRPVPTSVVKAMIAITCTIYALPTILFCVPAIRQTIENHAIALWHFLPLCISALIQLLAVKPMVEHRSRSQPAKLGLEKEYMRVYLNKDYSSLMVLYRIIFVLGLLANVFIPASPDNQRLITTNVVAYCLQSAFEMRNLGYATTRQAMSAMLIILLGTKMVGPIAVYAGTWHWRENVIYRLSK